jgi:hypothetical protein
MQEKMMVPDSKVLDRGIKRKLSQEINEWSKVMHELM